MDSVEGGRIIKAGEEVMEWEEGRGSLGRVGMGDWLGGHSTVAQDYYSFLEKKSIKQGTIVVKVGL